MTTPSGNPLNYAGTRTSTKPPLTGKAKAVRIAFICNFFLTAICAATYFLIGPIHAMEATRSPADAPYLIAGGLGLMCGGCGQLCSLVVSAVFFCIWIYNANEIAGSISQTKMQFTPGWAVGWFFIPLMNLVMPYRIMTEIWQQANAPTHVPNSKVSGWWTCYLLSGFISWAGAILGSKALGFYTAAAIIQCVVALLLIASGIFCLQLVREITIMLETKIGQAPATAAPPNPPTSAGPFP